MMTLYHTSNHVMLLSDVNSDLTDTLKIDHTELLMSLLITVQELNMYIIYHCIRHLFIWPTSGLCSSDS